MNRTLYDLIRELETRSRLIAAMGLASKQPDSTIKSHLFNLANEPLELDRIARAVDGLMSNSGLSALDAEAAVTNLLTERHFYGSFCELAAYEWLNRNNAVHSAQVKLTSTDVLNPNGCTIDGRFENHKVYFDIKGFGMQVYMMELYKERLSREAPGLTISIDGPIDVSVKDIETYAFGAIKELKGKLTAGSLHHLDHLGWLVRVTIPTRVTATEHTNDPYVFAETNRYYAFKTSRQFTRNDPFILVFPYSSRFNSPLASNVFNMTDTALRALARRAFIQLTSDPAPLAPHDASIPPGLTVGDAAKLVSGLLFINLDDDEAWMFLNPRATHKITRHQVDWIFDFTAPIGMGIDDFAHDDY